jgi:DnaK suppressor protein
MDVMRTENMYEEKHKQLKELEKVLTERVDGVSRDLSSTHSADSAEQVTERENEDVLRNLQEETKMELQQVRAALKRLDAGEYGVCASCGADISPARLQALPYATLCIHCAK